MTRRFRRSRKRGEEGPGAGRTPGPLRHVEGGGILDHTTEKLRELHKDAQQYTGPFELPEATEDDLASMRETVERAG